MTRPLRLLAGTNLAGGTAVSTKPQGDAVYDVRNIVVVFLLPVVSSEQLRNDLVDTPAYRRLAAVPPDENAIDIVLERPILHVE